MCKWLRDQIKGWEAEAKAELSHHMITDDRESATIGDIKVGAVTFCNGRREFVIDDEAAFAQWVYSRWPSEVETVMVVRPAFLAKLQQQANIHGVIVDSDGEVCPFAEVRRGTPYFMVKLSEEAGPTLQAMLSPRLNETMKELEQ